MDKDGWPIAVIAFVALGGPLLLIVATRLVGFGIDSETALPRTLPPVEVSMDPVRVAFGVGAAVLLVAAAMLVIRRTDWAIED